MATLTDNPPKDLLDLLLAKWQMAGADSEGPSVECREYLLAFLEYSRKTLKENLPIGTDNLHGVLAIRFQDLTSVPLVELPASDMMPGVSAHISRSGGGVSSTRAWGVTGEK